MNHWCISYRYKVIEQSSFSWDFLTDANSFALLRTADPQTINCHNSGTQKALPWIKPRRLSHRALKLDAWFGLWSCGRKENIKISEVARQGLVVLMVSTVLVLKHKTSNLRQRHNVISIDFKIGVGDNLREFTSLAKFGSDTINGRDATRGQPIRVL